MNYEALIRSTKRLIGNYIINGGGSEDKYVKDQIEKVKQWEQKLAEQAAGWDN